MATWINRNRALVVASKKLPFKSDSQLMKAVDFSGMDALEAYKCGAEEAQSAIVDRLAALPTISYTAENGNEQ